MSELPDETIVVRGGTMADRDSLAESAADCFAKDGVYGLSVVALEGRSFSALLAEVPSCKVPHNRVRQSTVARIRAAGCEVYPSYWHGHATLKLPNMPTENDWDSLDRAFDDPESNPAAKGRPRPR